MGDGNRVLVGLPERLDKYKLALRVYESREQAVLLLTAALSTGMIEVPTFVNEVEGILAEQVLQLPVDTPVET